MQEITHLKTKFPKNIKLFCAMEDKNILGGTILFITKNVIHVQYISACPEGKNKGALDLLFSVLVNETFSHFKYFDFGHSNESNGEYLNENLIFQKEGFGARGVANYIYQYELN